jgi:hypothetical protein
MMKKASTYYFAALVLLNGFLGWALGMVDAVMRDAFSDALGGKALPPLTELALAMPWWPYAAAVLCMVGFAGSITTGIRSQTLQHPIIAILGIELIIMFMSMAGYIVPWWTITVSMSP